MTASIRIDLEWIGIETDWACVEDTFGAIDQILPSYENYPRYEQVNQTNGSRFSILALDNLHKVIFLLYPEVKFHEFCYKKPNTRDVIFHQKRLFLAPKCDNFKQSFQKKSALSAFYLHNL